MEPRLVMKYSKMQIVLFGVIYLLLNEASAYKNLDVLHQWSTLEYGFRSEADREHAINSGHYNKSDPGFPIDVGIYFDSNMNSSKFFMTIPRFMKDSPYSLATISSRHTKNGPMLYPYPSYAWHNNDNKNCSTMTSAFRFAINECNQMWVIDSGFVKGSQICPPQLLVFSLTTNNLIDRYQFAENLYVANASLFMNIKLDIADPAPMGKCEKTMAYVSDSLYHGLIVFDGQRRQAWRVENRFMYPDPKWGVHSIDNFRFVQMGGIFAINLSPPKPSNQLDDRYIYFHAWASNKEIKVPLGMINNRSIWLNQVDAMDNIFKIVGCRKVQSLMEVIDSKGNLFSSTDDPLSVFVWNVNQPDETYNTNRVVVDDPSQLQFVSGMKTFISPSGQESILFLSSRYQKFRANNFNANDVNFRVMTKPTRELLGRGSDKPMY